MAKHKSLFLSAVLLLLSLTASARVQLCKIFSDGMVLQQQSQCRIWGRASAGKMVKVTTSWNGHIYRQQAGEDGHFALQVSTPVAGGPYTITISDGEAVTLRDILIGEVWICSGQSNMEMPVKGFKGQPVEGAAETLLDCDDQQLHLFTVKRRASLTPVDSVSGKWQQATSESVRSFSATAYYYGRALRRALNVPVGLIVTAWGGSACEAWMQQEWLQAFPTVKLPHDEADVKKRAQRCPTALYNGMLMPIAGYTMKGVIWYQGEDNVERSSYYADCFGRMIGGWREVWNQGDFPFYFCQIAPYDYSLIGWQKYNSALLREQQLRAEQDVKNCRMAVLLDAGLEYGIHPRCKRQAGERLALLSLSNTYGKKGLPDFAVYKQVEFHGDTADVTFDRSKEWIYFEHGAPRDNYEVAGEDRVFHKAKAWISRNHLYLQSDDVKKPVAVRYAFHDWVDADLMHDGLPVSSFRSDNW